MKTLAVLVLGIVCNWSVTAQTYVSADEIIDQINKGERVVYENAIIEGDLDFTLVENFKKEELLISPCEAGNLIDMYDRTSDNYYVDVNSYIEFLSCEFTGNITGYSVDEEENTIYNARFNNEVVFGDCKFYGDVNFKYSVFTQKTELESSTIAGNANFRYASFENMADFSRTSFLQEAHYNATHFSGIAMFQASEFESNVNFCKTQFVDGAYFNYANFSERAMFTYANFKKADFNNVNFSKLSSFSYTVFKDCASFKEARFAQRAEFSNTRFDKDLEMEGTTFYETPLFNNAIIMDTDVYTYMLKN